MNDRIYQIRKTMGLSQEEFAEKLSLSKNFISQLENGRRDPSQRTINDIVKIFGISEKWLITGEGKMYEEKNDSDQLMDFFIEVQNDKPDAIRKRLAMALSNIPRDKWDDIENTLIKIRDFINTIIDE